MVGDGEWGGAWATYLRAKLDAPERDGRIRAGPGPEHKHEHEHAPGDPDPRHLLPAQTSIN